MIERLMVALGLVLFTGLTIALNLYQKDASAAVPGVNTLISTNTAGTAAANSGSDSGYGSYMSPNGKYVAFKSNATNVMSSGGNGIFLKNLSSGLVTRVNISTSGVIANAGSTLYGISATGRYVIFTSTASNLIDGRIINTSYAQLYLRDTAANTTSILTLDSSGAPANGWVEGDNVSSDGRFVLFSSTATNLDPLASSGVDILYVWDRNTGSLSIVDRDSGGVYAGGNSSFSKHGSMSCDGSIIAFQSTKNLIVGNPSSSHLDVYVLDRRAGDKLTNLTVSANDASLEPTVSCNGDYIGFASAADNLDPTVSFTKYYTQYHPYIYDRVNSAFYVADRSAITGAVSTGGCWNTGNYSCVAVSDNGVGLFSLNQSSLTGVSSKQVYMRDINTGTTELLSKNSSGTAANSDSIWPSISSDGRKAAFYSGATNLVTTADTNNAMDVFTALTGN